MEDSRTPEKITAPVGDTTDKFLSDLGSALYEMLKLNAAGNDLTGNPFRRRRHDTKGSLPRPNDDDLIEAIRLGCGWGEP